MATSANLKRIITGTRASDGATVYRTLDGHWSLFLDDAATLCCDDADRVAATIAIRGDSRVAAVNVVDVDTSGGPCVPLDAEEAARLAGTAETTAIIAPARAGLAAAWA